MNRVLAALLLPAVMLLWNLSLYAAPPELLKWVPQDGSFYAELYPRVILSSPLFGAMSRKYPQIKTYEAMGRRHVGGYDGELEAAVLTMSGDTASFAVFLYFSKPFDVAEIEKRLAVPELKGVYRKTSIVGRKGYILNQQQVGGMESCFVMLSNRIMFGGSPETAQQVINGAKLRGQAVAALQKPVAKQLFFRLVPGTAADAGSLVTDFRAEGMLGADSSLKFSGSVRFRDERMAQNVEQQIRQWLMIGAGMVFADDGELGLAVVRQVRVSRKKADLTVEIVLPQFLIDRLIAYGITRAERGEKKLLEEKRFREERRRQQLPPKNRTESSSAEKNAA